MVVITCPVPGCGYATSDREAALANCLAAELNGHTAGVHTAAAPGAARPDRTSIKRPDRPVMKEDASDQDWKNFSFEWENYKTVSGITDVNTIRTELQYCCNLGLWGRLLQMKGEAEL